MAGHIRVLPLDRDDSRRYLPWIVAVMVYLAAMTLAGAMATASMASRWQTGLTGALTVQLQPAAETQANDGRMEAVLSILRADAAVASAEPVDEEKMLGFIQPWLGRDGLTLDLPLPRLVDVRLHDRASVDLVDLAARLEAAAPGTSVDDHARWLTGILKLARVIRFIAFGTVALIAAAAITVLVFATRAALAVHKDGIALLHIMGARNRFIAREFQVAALAQGFRGGLIGLLTALATLVALGGAGLNTDIGILPQVTLTTLQWLVLAALPPAAGAVALITARLTVLSVLARLA